MRRPIVVSGLLVCEQCVKVSDDQARVWCALHGREDNDTEVVVVLCPTCADDFERDGQSA